MNKLVKYLLYFWMFFFTIVSIMGITRHVYLNGNSINGKPKDLVTFLADLPSNIYNYKKLNQCQFLVKNEFDLKNGFTYNRKNIPNDYLLISVWDHNENQSIVKLISIKSGKTIYKWSININELNHKYNQYYIYDKKNNQNNRSTRISHPYLSNNGDLIFIGSGLNKVNKKSKIIWSYPNFKAHHSIEKFNENEFWVCSYNSNLAKSNKYHIKDDCISKINIKTGKTIYQKSIFDILIQNGYNIGEILINTDLENNHKFIDYFHLNDIQPVMFDSKYWKKGDVFISLRNKNMIILFRPSTNKIIWKKTGPWLKQHDVTIIDSNRIGLFNNDIIDGKFENPNKTFLNQTNNHCIYDFEKNNIITKYSKIFKSAKIKTIIEGHSLTLKNGNIFIEETTKGRLLFGDEKGLIWTYVEKIDEEHLSMFSWSRYITEEEFSKFTFLKNK